MPEVCCNTERLVQLDALLEPLDLRWSQRVAALNTEHHARVSAMDTEHRARLREIKSAHYEETRLYRNERMRLLAAADQLFFELRPLGCIGDELFVDIPHGHPLEVTAGQVDALFEKPACPFKSHWGHLSVQDRAASDSCSKSWFLVLDVFSRGQQITQDESESSVSCRARVPLTRWSDMQIVEARAWISGQIKELASMERAQVQALITPHQKSIFRAQ